MLPGLAATLDDCAIKIENAISAITQVEIVANGCDAAMLNNQNGALFARTLSAPQTTGPYGLIDEVTQKELEFPRLEASGVDVDVASTFDLDAVGLKSAIDLRLGVSGADLESRDDFPFAAEASRANPAKFGLNDPDWA